MGTSNSLKAVLLITALQGSACSERETPASGQPLSVTESAAVNAARAARPEESAAGSVISPQPQPQQLLVGDGRLWLEGCTVKYESEGKTSSIPLDLKTPCAVSVDADGKPAMTHTKWGISLLVVSSRKIEQQTDGLSPGDCDTRIQGVLIAGNTMLVSPQAESFAMCGSGPWDEKLYHILASRAHTGARSNH